MSPELLEKMPLWQREHHLKLNDLRVVRADMVEALAALRLPVAARTCRWLDDWYFALMEMEVSSGASRQQAAQIIQRARR